MKVAIAHYKTSRQIEGSGFDICGSQKDLMRIADQIREAAEKDFVYGWVSVRDEMPNEHAGSNQAPISWDQ